MDDPGPLPEEMQAELIVGVHPGRESDDEITNCLSLGIAVEDIAASALVYRNAMAAGKGFEVEFGCTRHG